MLGMTGKKEFYPHGRFYYRVCGKPENKPLLFLHGYGGSPFSFRAVIQLLSKKFFVVAPYLSKKWKKYKIRDVSDFNFEALVDFLAEAIDKLKIEKPIVMGYSMGGLLATKLALKYPKKIKGLVIVDGLVITPNKTLKQLAKEFFKGNAARRIFTKRGLKTFGPKYLDFVKNLFLHPLILLNQAEYCSKADEGRRLGDLNVKTLILWGNEDNLFPLEFASKIKKAIKNSELEIVNGDHLWGISNPEVLFEKVVKFSETL